MMTVFWQGKKVFLTGHTGFKGSWLSLWLQQLGAQVCGFSLAPEGEINLFQQARIAEGMTSYIGDIRDFDDLSQTMQDFQPDIVIHMAAQALVRKSYQNPIETYQTNIMGTVHVFEAARKVDSIRAILNITSDKCYANRETLVGYRENEPMGGFDPYSSSKGCAELVTDSYRNSFFIPLGVGLASARAGNVIGGGDWSNDRLIPDVIRACLIGKNVCLRYPKATRPWQHVLEPLQGYLKLAQSLYQDPLQYAQGWNFGPNQQKTYPVEQVVQGLLQYWKGSSQIQYETEHQPHEAQSLVLDSSKAINQLGWLPCWDLAATLEKIVDWHKKALVEENMRAYTMQQIEEYTETHVNAVLL